MYSVDLARTWVDPAEGEVVSLVASLNQPLVQAAAERPTEPTQAYIITRQYQGGFDVLVYFHLLDSNVAVIYGNDETPVSADDLTSAQDEAQDLVLSMGFLLENRDIEALEGGQRMELLKELPPFHQDLAPFARVEEEEEEGPQEVDEVDEFRRAREALAEAGQDDASKFVPETTDTDLPTAGSMPIVGGTIEDLSAGVEELPDASDLLEMSAPNDGIADLDDLDLTGELEAIPEGSGSGALDALLDEVEVDGPVGEPAATSPPPTLSTDAVEPLEDIPIVDGAPVPAPLEVDELLAEVSQPGPALQPIDEPVEPSFVEIGAGAPAPVDEDLAEIDGMLDAVIQPDEASSFPEVEVAPDLAVTDDGVDLDAGDIEIEADDIEIGADELDDLEIPAVAAPEPASPLAPEHADPESLGDQTMSALLDAVEGLEPADVEDDDFQVEVSLDDEDMFTAPDELVADDAHLGSNGVGVAGAIGNGIDAEAAAAVARQVEAEDLVRLLSLL